MIIDTTPGKTYAVTSPNGCTVTQHVGEVDIVTDVPAGLQTLIIAHASKFEIDDDSAIVTECGGSAELVFTAATTRAASSDSGSDGMTAAERALLNGAAQRDADNTFTAGNTFTGAVDMSGAQVTPPEGWNVEGAELTAEAIQATAPLKWGDGVDATGAASAPLALTFGSAFTDTAGSYTCTTEGTGSITIGAGANTLNYTAADGSVKESSNSVTIGCKASNQRADSVTIGASASNTGMPGIAIGANAKTTGEHAIRIGYGGEADRYSMAFGSSAKAIGNMSMAIGAGAQSTLGSISIGYHTSTSGNFSVAVGYAAAVSSLFGFAIGYSTKNSDQGTGVFSVMAMNSTQTQLYFAGANTPLANEYYNGEAFMGYTTKDAAGTVVACGTRRLSELFPDNSLTQPATLDEFGEWVAPKVFHPSDLDMPTEETTEPEEYQPLPVYPIVEPEIPEMEEV